MATAILLWVACWKFRLGRVWTVFATIVAMVVGMGCYSAMQQYQNLKEQYEDLRASEEQWRLDTRKANALFIGVRGALLQLEYKIEASQQSLKQLQDRTEEISRNLPKPKTNRVPK